MAMSAGTAFPMERARSAIRRHCRRCTSQLGARVSIAWRIAPLSSRARRWWNSEEARQHPSCSYLGDLQRWTAKVPAVPVVLGSDLGHDWSSRFPLRSGSFGLARRCQHNRDGVVLPEATICDVQANTHWSQCMRSPPRRHPFVCTRTWGRSSRERPRRPVEQLEEGPAAQAHRDDALLDDGAGGRRIVHVGPPGD